MAPKPGNSEEVDEHSNQVSGHVPLANGTEPTTSPSLRKWDASEDHILENDYYKTGVKNRDFLNGFTSSDEAILLKDKVKSFAESSRLIMDLLDDVAQVHPFIAVAVLAFKSVVNLELKRRENDQKVLALYVKMQEMMEVLAQLRFIKPAMKAHDDQGTFTVEDRLAERCATVAEAIKNCGNLCDTYSSKHFLVKLLKGPIYEMRLSEFVDTFAEHQKAFEFSLTLFTAQKVHSAQIYLSDIQSTVKVTQKATMLLVFQQLKTPAEKELLELVQSKGGIDECIKDDSVLAELLQMMDAKSSRHSTPEDPSDNSRRVSTSSMGTSMIPTHSASSPYNTSEQSPPYTLYNTPGQSPPYAPHNIPGQSPPYAPYHTPGQSLPYTPYHTPGQSLPYTPYHTPGQSLPYTPYNTPGQSPLYAPYNIPGQSPPYTLYNMPGQFPPHTPYNTPSPSYALYDKPAISAGMVPPMVPFTAQNAAVPAALSPASRMARPSSTPVGDSMTSNSFESPYYANPHSVPISTQVMGGHWPTTSESLNINPPVIPRPQSRSSTNERKKKSIRSSLQPGEWGEIRSEFEEVKAELSEDVAKSVEKNKVVFDKKIRILGEQIEELRKVMMKATSQSEKMIDGLNKIEGLASGPHLRVLDPELRVIWKEMGWKLSVHASKFVSTLHDFYIAQHHSSEMMDEILKSDSIANQQETLRRLMDEAKKRTADKWALEHVNIANLQSIVAVFDMDANEYVNVWEANSALAFKPEGWSLLQWIAYWVSGRHHTIWMYRNKICQLILVVHHLLEKVLPTNRALLDQYLDGLQTLETILMSTTPCSEEIESTLTTKTKAYMISEERRLDQKLAALDYEIDDADTLALLIGIGRYQIERYIYPLLYLLLKHHFTVLKKGCSLVLDRREIDYILKSFGTVFEAMDMRVDTLREIFNTKAPETVPEQFKDFAYGLYHDLAMGHIPVFDFDVPPSDAEVLSFASAKHTNSLKYVELSTIFEDDIIDVSDIETCITGLQGVWTGICFTADALVNLGIMSLNLTVAKSDDEGPADVTGRGCFSTGKLEFSGKYDPETKQIEGVLAGIQDYSGDPEFHFSLDATLEEIDFVESPSKLPTQYRIIGIWTDPQNHLICGYFHFTQTPTWVHRFRPILMSNDLHDQWKNLKDTSSSDYTEKTRARKLWSFARSAIMHQVRMKRGTLAKDYVLEQFRWLRRCTELNRSQYLTGETRLPEKSILSLILTPRDLRYSNFLARTDFKWATLHYNVKCFFCETTIFGPRYITFSDNWHPPDPFNNFCEKCVFRTGMFHDSDRYVLKVQYFLHRVEFTKLMQRTLEVSGQASFVDFESVPFTPNEASRRGRRRRRVRFLSVMQEDRPSGSLPASESDIFIPPVSESPTPDHDDAGSSTWNSPAHVPGLSDDSSLASQLESSSDTEDSERVDDFNLEQSKCIYCGNFVVNAEYHWTCVSCTILSPLRLVCICRYCETKKQPQMSLHLDSGHLTHHPLTRILHPARTRATPITIEPSAPIQNPVRLWPSYDSNVNQPTPFIPPEPSSDRSSSPSFLEMPSPRDSTYPHPSLRSYPVPTSPALPYSMYPRPAVPPVSSVIPTFNRDFGVASENIAPVIPYVPPEVWPWPPLRLQTRLIRDGEGLYYDSDTSSPISPDARETSNDEREVSSPVQTEIPVADLIQLSPPNPTIDIPDEIIEPEFDGNADPRSPRSTSRQPLPTIMEVSSSELSSTEPTTPDRWTLTLSAPSRNLSESSNNITDPALTMRTIFDY